MYNYFRINEDAYLYEILTNENINDDYEYTQSLRKNKRMEDEINE